MGSLASAILRDFDQLPTIHAGDDAPLTLDVFGELDPHGGQQIAKPGTP